MPRALLHLSIRWKIVIPVAGFFVALLTLLAILYAAVRAEVIDDARRRLEYEAARTSGQIAEQLSHMSALTKIAILREPDARPTLEHTAANGIGLDEERLLNGLLFDVLFVGNDVHSTFVFDRSGNGVYKLRSGLIRRPLSPVGMPWYEQALGANGSPVYVPTYSLDDFAQLPTAQGSVFGVARGLVALGPARVTGVIVVNTGISYIAQLAERFDLTAERRIVLTDREGTAIYDSLLPLDEQPGKIVTGSGNPIDAEELFGASFTLPESGWQLTVTVPRREVLAPMRLVSTSIIGGGVLMLAITILLLRALSRQIVEPLSSLASSMQRLEQGQFDVPAHGSQARDEIGALTHAFDTMVHRLKRLVHERYLRKLQLKELEIENLQRQINPHFLYNSLETLHMSAEANHDQETALGVRTLSRFLRYSISSSDELVTIEDEMAHLQEYLSFHRMMSDTGFRVRTHVDPSARSVRVPSLIVQPLVENAIEHGIRQLGAQGEIRVTATVSQDELAVAVIDNGKGMGPSQLAALRDGLHRETPPDSHVGIWNVNRRVRLIFGDDYGLTVESTPESGTSVTVRLKNR